MLNRATPPRNTTPHLLTSVQTTSQSAAVENRGEGKGNASVSGEAASPSEPPLRLPPISSSSQVSSTIQYKWIVFFRCWWCVTSTCLEMVL